MLVDDLHVPPFRLRSLQMLEKVLNRKFDELGTVLKLSRMLVDSSKDARR